MTGLWGTLLLSLLIALPATALAAAVAVPVAYAAARWRFRGKTLLEALVIIPLVLPPTVVGYLLILLLGRRGFVGGWIARWTDGYSIMFRPEGGILAAAIVAMPLVYLPAKAAFRSIEQEMEDIAQINGASVWQTFWLVSLPIAMRGVASGLVLAFARALGEFGATVMVMGSDQHTTLPIAVYNAWIQGELSQAAGPAIVLTSIALLLAILFNRLPRG
jgi:molybdate transport system permease protein